MITDILVIIGLLLIAGFTGYLLFRRTQKEVKK